MDCTFDGSQSTGFPGRWRWTMKNGDKTLAFTSSDPVTKPPADCTFLGGGSISDGAVSLTVELVVSTSDQQSEVASRGIRFYPNGACGY
jgi:hypothetical protein